MLLKTLLLNAYHFTFLLVFARGSYVRRQFSEHLDSSEETNYDEIGGNMSTSSKNSCWMTMNAASHFSTMDELEGQYAAAIKRFAEESASASETFDNQTLVAMLASQGRIESNGIKIDEIPAGLNLGGDCIMRMKNSLLFFNRMKLRNSTTFQINRLHTDLAKMTLTAELNLQDLHLMGNYERAITSTSDESVLFYTPTYGQIEIQLKAVKFNLEGRLRFIHNSLNIATIQSDIDLEAALLQYRNIANQVKEPIWISRKTISDFLERMKHDLDKWLKDYFNHYLIFFFEAKAATNKAYCEYDNKKTVALNDYAEVAVNYVRSRIKYFNGSSVMLPNFDIKTDNAMELTLANGNLTGLETLYRRSVATGKNEDKYRKVDFAIGFSHLKAVYKYTAHMTPDAPPLEGILIMTANEAVAEMAITLLKNPPTASLKIDCVEYLKPQSLVVEGPANRVIANFKHILDYHVNALMANAIYHKIMALNTLSQCSPRLFGNDNEITTSKEIENEFSDEINNDESVTKESKSDRDSYSESKNEISSYK